MRKLLFLLLLALPTLAQTPPGAYGPSVGAAGSSVPANSPLPLATSGPGPVFNVMNYGTKGNARSNLGNFTNGQAQFTCATCSFTQADVGLFISAQNVLVGTTIASVQNATTATVASAGAIATNASAPFVYGTNDDVAVKVAIAAALAKACVINGQKTANTCIPGAAPTIYFPAGGYLFCNFGAASGLINIGAVKGVTVMGDGRDNTFIYSCLLPTVPAANFGWFLTVASGADAIIWKGMTVDAVTGGTNIGQAALIQGATHISDIHIQRLLSPGVVFTGGPLNVVDHLIVDTSAAGAIGCIGCSGTDFYSSSSSNNTCPNIKIQNATGVNTGSGFKWYGGLVDECGGGTSNVVDVLNSEDVWFIGASTFSTGAGNAYNVDGTSYLHLSGGVASVFGNDTNANGVKILAGGVIQASDVRFGSTGTGNCINNAGIFNDNGGNSCENIFPIASGTSTGTAAVLTVTTLGAAPNANCSVGDALIVEGASPAGYNGYYPAGATSGITAVSATTISYTTAGSNLGAATTVGQVTCRNMQSFTGALPKALLNNPVPNTCYVTGTFGATVTGAPMCAFKTQSATNISNIKASSTTVTACTVAPVVTISDGTGTITLTLTTAKSLWDSSVDTSTGVGTTIFKPNGTIQVTNTVGTCTTSPTNFSVSYNISPILSN